MFRNAWRLNELLQALIFDWIPRVPTFISKTRFWSAVCTDYGVCSPWKTNVGLWRWRIQGRVQALSFESLCVLWSVSTYLQHSAHWAQYQKNTISDNLVVKVLEFKFLAKADFVSVSTAVVLTTREKGNLFRVTDHIRTSTTYYLNRPNGVTSIAVCCDELVLSRPPDNDGQVLSWLRFTDTSRQITAFPVSPGWNGSIMPPENRSQAVWQATLGSKPTEVRKSELSLDRIQWVRKSLSE